MTSHHTVMHESCEQQCFLIKGGREMVFIAVLMWGLLCLYFQILIGVFMVYSVCPSLSLFLSYSLPLCRVLGLCVWVWGGGFNSNRVGGLQFILLIQGQFPIMQSECIWRHWNTCITNLHIYVRDTHTYMHASPHIHTHWVHGSNL